MARLEASGPRRRLFDALEDRGRLVRDAVVLAHELSVPHEHLTAASLLDWVLEPGFKDEVAPHEHAELFEVAFRCNEAITSAGRGATVAFPPFADSNNGDGCCAKVHFRDGTTCRVYPDRWARSDGTVAIVTGLPGEVCELRYRLDESVALHMSDGSRLIKRPRVGTVVRQDVYRVRDIHPLAVDQVVYSKKPRARILLRKRDMEEMRLPDPYLAALSAPPQLRSDTGRYATPRTAASTALMVSRLTPLLPALR
eukprot:TRINITY_DN51389_c0_g1_i1.p1 TRINITY_DN51389_c0_g1~~TRINITY_DN51389_c0_g1_i1.p1  ORF type:complete len:279 (-),score=32.41 TRINITY_DN51389_c0_g1_i1:54-815(-)